MSAPAETHFSDFRPELQGLRAIAVLMVLVHHLWPERLQGGFVGVDVFFVISGFLITRLLLIEVRRTDRLDLLRFWARRIRRLLPAATLVLLVSLLGTYLLLPATQWMDTARQILASALYVQNWALVAQAIDYGARGAAPSPVLHYWSLSIEEQFYLVWPVLVLLSFKIGGSKHFRLAVGCLAMLSFFASLSLSIYSAFYGTTASYYITTGRVWELATGGFLAVAERRLHLPLWYRIMISWTGLAAIFTAGLVSRLDMAFPGWIALLPVLGTVLVIAGGQAGDWSPAPVLSWGPARFIGDISYSVYLWHWPLIVFLPFWAEGERFLMHDKKVQFGVSLLLATITKFAIEDPFRKGPFAQGATLRWPAFAAGALLVVTTVSLSGGLMCHQEKVVAAARVEHEEFRLNDPVYPGAAAMDGSNPGPQAAAAIRPDPLIARNDVPRVYRDGCDLRQTETASICEYGDPVGKVKIALVGDSHAAQYLPALEVLAEHYHWRILILEKSACLFNTVPVRIRSSGMVKWDCEQWKKKALGLLLSASPDLVITSAGMPFIYNDYYQLPGAPDLVAGYREIWGALTRKGIPVVVIRDNPRPFIDIPTCVWQNQSRVAACRISREQSLDRHSDPLSEAVARQSQVHLVDLTDHFCEGGQCPAVVGNILVYRDGDHLTATYARTLAPYLGRHLQQMLQAAREDVLPQASE